MRSSRQLFRRVYPERGLSAILRPESKLSWQTSRFCRLYTHLYPSGTQEQPELTTGEVGGRLFELLRCAACHVIALQAHFTTLGEFLSRFAVLVLKETAVGDAVLIGDCCLLPTIHYSPITIHW